MLKVPVIATDDRLQPTVLAPLYPQVMLMQQPVRYDSDSVFCPQSATETVPTSQPWQLGTEQQQSSQRGLGRKRILSAPSECSVLCKNQGLPRGTTWTGYFLSGTLLPLSAYDGRNLLILEPATHSAIPHMGSQFLQSP